MEVLLNIAFDKLLTKLTCRRDTLRIKTRLTDFEV